MKNLRRMVFVISKAFGSPKIKEEDNNERQLGGGKENQLKQEAAVGPPLGWEGQAQHQHLAGGGSEEGGSHISRNILSCLHIQ